MNIFIVTPSKLAMKGKKGNNHPDEQVSTKPDWTRFHHFICSDLNAQQASSNHQTTSLLQALSKQAQPLPWASQNNYFYTFFL